MFARLVPGPLVPIVAGIAVAVVALAPAAPADAAGFTVEGRQVLRDGLPFQVRGVCYQPTPIGHDPSAAPPHGDYYTAQYAALVARDLPLIRALGANVVRVYGWNPAADHRGFLDACYNDGVDPVFVFVNRWIDPATTWSSPAAVQALQQEFLQLDAGLGDHPAVLGVILGNEANAHHGSGADPAFWAAMNTVATAIKAQTPGRLVSVAITDALGQVGARDASMTALDLWCVQVYRGASFGSFFSQYAAVSTRPLIVTEFGIDAWDNSTGAPYPDNGAFVASTVASLWTEIAAAAEVCAGACVFSFADEWWKAGGPNTQDAGGFPASLPDGFANEEWWGLYAVSRATGGPDVLTPRATVDALRTAWMPPAVTITAPPLSQTIPPGGDAVFSVEAALPDGVGATYQWYKDGAAIPGATGATLALSALTGGDTGWYTVRVSAGAASVLSEPARLLVATPQPGPMVNLSVRSQTGVGDGVLIAGFVIDGNVPRRVLIRGVGPGLVPFGVQGAVEDPVLRLYDGDDALIATNDDWSAAPEAAAIVVATGAVGAFPLAAGGRDAAMVRTLVPGRFTAHVGDAADAGGIALLEVYDAP